MNDKMQTVHNLTQKQIIQRACSIRMAGKLYDLQKKEAEGEFCAGIDGFSFIAYKVRHARKILDIGPGSGILVSLLSELGHECYVVDIYDSSVKYPEIYKSKKVPFHLCNTEIDALPFSDNFFDAVICSEVLEHFAHSHLRAVNEMSRVLAKDGTVVVEVPNAVSFHKRSRMLRGKHITWDYKKHYLYAEPLLYKGLSFYPDRHNREFTNDELKLLLQECKFRNVEVYFDKSRRYRSGLQRIKSIGSAVRDMIPSLRKTLIGIGKK